MNEKYQKSILLVEDEAITALSESTLLKENGYNVMCAYSGEDALSIFNSHKPIDLILMDIDLGKGMDGTEVAEIILKERNIPIIFLSSHNEPEIVDRTEKITSYGYIVKNSGDTILVAAVKMAFRLFEARKKEKEAEERYYTTIKSIGDAVIVTDMLGKVELLNPIAEDLTGWKNEEVQGKPLDEIFNIVNEENHKTVENPVKRVLREGNVIGLANHTLLISRDGREIPIADSGAPIKDVDGKTSGVVLVFRDQSAERKAQKTILEAKLFAEGILDTIREALVVLDPDLNIISVNKYFYKIFRVNPEETINRKIYDIGNRQWNIPALRKLLEEILPLNTSFSDYEVTHNFERIGNRTMLLNARRIYRENNKTEMILLAIEDVTEKKNKEIEIKKAASEWEKTFDTVDDAICILDREQKIIRTNKKMEELFNPADKQIAGKYCWEIVHGTNEPIADCPILRAFKTLTRETMELKIEDKWFEITVDPLLDSEGNFGGAVHIVKDITRHKKIEEALYDECNFNKTLVQRSPAFIVAISKEGKTLEMNESMLNALGYKREEIIGTDYIKKFVPVEDRKKLLKVFESLVTKKENTKNENFIMAKDGRLLLVEWYGTPIFRGETFEYFVGIGIDITEKRFAENSLKKALEEKNSLLRELQHRVKNTLTMISSLIGLELERSGSPEKKDALENLKGRINTISRLYHLLHGEGNPKEVRLDLYISDLVSSIISGFTGTNESIEVKLDLEEVQVDTKIASYYGLIINEIISNSIKYAFPDGKKGVIKLKLNSGKKGIILEVSDNGIGLPADFDSLKSKGLGFMIISLLAEQVESSMKIQTDNGTSFIFKPRTI